MSASPAQRKEAAARAMKAKRLRLEGLNNQRIAERLGVSVSEVGRLVKKAEMVGEEGRTAG